jgi:hypothetical protein
MNGYRFFYMIFLITTIIGCRKDNNDIIEEFTEDCFRLSELHTKTNHLLPFKLYNDIDSGLNKIILNDEDMNLRYGHSFEFPKSGFFDLVLVHTGTESLNDTILFTIGTEERQAAEWGIETWVPAAFTVGQIDGGEIESIYPGRYMNGIDVPFLFYVLEEGAIKPVYSEGTCQQTQQRFFVKRGVGSVLVKAAAISGPMDFNIGGIIAEPEITKIEEADLELQGEVTEDVLIPENTVVKITADLHILSGASVTVGAGAVLLIDEAVNIVNDGPVTFNGEIDNPVLVTCLESGKFWGGFISSGATAEITADYTFFCESGYHQTGEYTSWGHAMCQALFYTDQSRLTLNHCYILDNKGQIFYPQHSTLTLESIVVQRAKTGGQLNYTVTSIQNSIFTDFPDDSLVYRDADNDALYINASDVTIDNCTFMYAKDDGMDSGLNEGGTVTVTNSRFEACFHEGAALSSQNNVVKTHTFSNCIFFNCGQGLELGFSSPNHSVTADNCRFINNYIGIRYGDNYDWSNVNGYMLVKNSQSLNNGKDVWNMVRMLWAPKLDHLQFENTQVSALVDQYPDLEIIPE